MDTNTQLLNAAKAALPLLRREHMKLAEKYAGTPFENDPAYKKAENDYRNAQAAIDAAQQPAPAPASLETLKAEAHAKLREAEKAWHAYFAECDVGGERIFASNVYDILRTATREAQ